jgi:hypothetical protein
MDDPELDNLPFGVMVSYVYWHPKDQERMEWAQEHGRPTFLDCGAFSALTLGVYIDVNEYIKFAKARKHLFTHIASLDVVYDAKETAANHQRMLDAGFTNAIPAFHANDPWEYLDAMEGSERVALGGVAGMAAKKKPGARWLRRCFDRVHQWEHPPKMHGFGITGPEWLWGFPWDSVDSSSWFMAARFCRMFFRKGWGLKAHGKKDPPRGDLKRYQEWRRAMPPAKGTRPDYYPLLRHNVKVFARLVQDITEYRERS